MLFGVVLELAAIAVALWWIRNTIHEGMRELTEVVRELKDSPDQEEQSTEKGGG